MYALSPDDTKNNVAGQWLADSAFYKEPAKSEGQGTRLGDSQQPNPGTI